MWLQFLNIFFFVFHTLFTLFNMTGWAFKRTRKLHLVTILLTTFSWFILGIWYGWGYCACTDWHWDVRAKMGIQDRSNSYIHFLIHQTTGVDIDPKLVEIGTLIVFLLSFVLTVVLNTRDRKRSKANKQ